MKREEIIEEPKQPDTRTTLSRWKCNECQTTQAGFIEPTDYRPRRCMGIPKDRSTDRHGEGQRICGAMMEQIYREDGAKA